MKYFLVTYSFDKGNGEITSGGGIMYNTDPNTVSEYVKATYGTFEYKSFNISSTELSPSYIKQMYLDTFGVAAESSNPNYLPYTGKTEKLN